MVGVNEIVFVFLYVAIVNISNEEQKKEENQLRKKVTKEEEKKHVLQEWGKATNYKEAWEIYKCRKESKKY